MFEERKRTKDTSTQRRQDPSNPTKLRSGARIGYQSTHFHTPSNKINLRPFTPTSPILQYPGNPSTLKVSKPELPRIHAHLLPLPPQRLPPAPVSKHPRHTRQGPGPNSRLSLPYFIPPPLPERQEPPLRPLPPETHHDALAILQIRFHEQGLWVIRHLGNVIHRQ